MEKNKIYLGDAYELIKQLPDQSVDLIYTDIPYDIEGNGGGGCFGSKKRDYHKEYYEVCEKKNASDIHTRMAKSSSTIQEIAYGIDWNILEEFCRVLKHIYIYIWCSKKQLLPLMKYFIEEKGCFFELLLWHKTNPIPAVNNSMLGDTEYCLMFREKGTSINNEGSYATKSKYYISGINKEDKENFIHPTCKPVDFIMNHIKNSTKEGDLILDPFCGSGSTLIAAKRTNRNYIGFEIEEKWFNVACERLQGINQKGEMNLFDVDYE